MERAADESGKSKLLLFSSVETISASEERSAERDLSREFCMERAADESGKSKLLLLLAFPLLFLLSGADISD